MFKKNKYTVIKQAISKDLAALIYLLDALVKDFTNSVFCSDQMVVLK